MTCLLKRYSVSASSPESSLKSCAGANAISEPSRWQREQLHDTTPLSSSSTSNLIFTHRQPPRYFCFMGTSQFAHHIATEAIDHALARERNERNLARLARLEPHGTARRDVEAHPARFLAVEFQRRICLEEMIMRADLDRPVAGIGHAHRDGLAALIELDFAVLDECLARDHVSALLGSLRRQFATR